MVTKKMAWLFIALIAPVTFTSLGVGFRVWGQSEFFLIDAVKSAALKMTSIESKVTRIETQVMFLGDRMEKQLDRIKVLEAESQSDRQEIIKLLKGKQISSDRDKRS